jgi:amino acid transporter
MAEVSKKDLKKISLFSATMLCATCMIGSGWLFSSQINAQIAGNYAFISWWAAAAFVMVIGLSYIPVAQAFPVRGVIVRCCSLTHNSCVGMPFAFANLFGLLVGVATEAQASVQYIAGAFQKADLMQGNHLTHVGKLLATILLALYLLINYYGIQWLVKFNNPITALKILTPILVIIVLISSNFDTSNFHLATGSTYGLSSIPNAILGAGLVYSFHGYQIILSYANEIENPKRNIWLSMILALLLTASLFSLLQLAFMGATPHAMLQSTGWNGINFSSPFVQLTLLFGLHVLSLILIADSVVSPSATGYVLLGATSRMLYSMAKEKQLPGSSFIKLNQKYNFSRSALIICTLITTAFLWLASSWSSLMLIVSSYFVFGYLAAPISMGAIAPKKRFLGLIVFLLITAFIQTLGPDNLLPTNISLTILMLLYLVGQRHLPFKKFLYFTLPFMIYIWMMYFKLYEIVTLIVAAIIYWFITSKTFVQRSKDCRSPQELIANASD